MIRRRVGRAGWLIAMLAVTGCSREASPPTAREDPTRAHPRALAEAREAAAALGRELQSTLLAELRAGGPSGAIEVCAKVAPRLARRHSRAGLVVRRVSLKARNPADEPDDYERHKLQELEDLHQRGVLPGETAEIVDAAPGKRQLRYLRPILVQPPCLACHGDPAGIDLAVLGRLRQLYPADRAVGYVAGELRGAFSVTVDLP